MQALASPFVGARVATRAQQRVQQRASRLVVRAEETQVAKVRDAVFLT